MASGFFAFYNSVFAMFCPLWVGETQLSGLRMVGSLPGSNVCPASHDDAG